MKELIFILFLLSVCGVVNAQDRLSVRVEFKKFVWLCPSCQNEEIVDASPAGGNTYEHTCSKCGAKFNQSGPNMKEYNGVLQYPLDTYPKVKQEDIDTEKKARCDKWLYEVKNPPPHQEPSAQDYLNLCNEKIDEAIRYLDEYSKKATTDDLDKVKNESKEKIDHVKKNIPN